MALLNRTELYERLSQNIVQVSFNKVNGDQRLMRCTLQESLIEECPSEYTLSGLPEDSGRMNVWDLEKSEWRSFLIQNVNWVLTHDE